MASTSHVRPATIPNQRRCFVTIGATASFRSLISVCLQPSFVQALDKHGFTELRIQYGKGGQELFDDLSKGLNQAALGTWVEISGFDINVNGLTSELRAVKASQDVSEGLVISHAGSGTILDAMRLDVPLIVVPNPELLDNHQIELAEVFSDQGYLVYGELRNLPKALDDSKLLRRKQKEQINVNTGRPVVPVEPRSIMEYEMGFSLE
ncbi:beta-1,4-N-acetylglucosaminyltransferase [Eremomyces bilateralis CBS 781.70]|uniref:UDP-N-acetylglucosamine transferase subunit ALG13 n=1 Tax=Eremomyces bilateralis CBS 781.70 TaxID=1392243 RepID=A0A6G1G2E7_9PEZI|nr:beta-1,4-N-acetylglucosaminyltransferase [Eremomyces bilateralis CBS 781.70]KAF1812162.1 beta-1,4-N-acetylglucosaminyltransferase [Eremomyces bilateralis CBS 781.70]